MAVDDPLTAESPEVGDTLVRPDSRRAATRHPWTRPWPGSTRSREPIARPGERFPHASVAGHLAQAGRLRRHPAGLADRGLGPLEALHPPVAEDRGRQLWDLLGTSLFWQACWVTAQQAVIGYALVVVIGGIVGTAVARIPVLRAGIGSLITGMQTMPSVLWYPLGIMVFGVTWKAIILMMVLGAAPAVANGFISGIDQVPPSLLRVGRILGARGLALERHVVLPAAFPSILGGLKQGWAFAWHALMAGEFLILVTPLSLGGRTVNAQTQGDYGVVVAMMIVIVFIGIMVDVAFTRIDRSVLRRYGLLESAGLILPDDRVRTELTGL